MSTPFPPPTPAAYTDRHAACVAFGVAEVVMGLFCGAVAAVVVLAASLVPGSMDPRGLAISSGFYALLSVVLIWLGIGSMLCRRWARTLLLILAWSWLVAGLTCVAMLAIILPQMLAQITATSGTAALTVSLVVLCVVGVFFVVVPGVMILFYQGKHVQATFETRDPHPRWTDACPLSVLTTSLWFALGAFILALTSLGQGSVVPFFGRLISGPPATALTLLVAGFWLWLAWAFYRLQIAALWVSIVASVIWFASSVITFARVDFLEVYRLMGYPPEQIEAIRQLGVLGGQTMAWMMALLGVATIAFLIWLRKYFPARASQAPAP